MPRGPIPNPETKRTNRRAHPVVEAPTASCAGPVPDPPAGLSDAAIDAWNAWFAGWWAVHWTTSDLPMLRLIVLLWDRARGGLDADPPRSFPGAVVGLLDRFGLTPKGRQDLRWQPPAPPAVDESVPPRTSPYEHLGGPAYDVNEWRERQQRSKERDKRLK
jgi:hypothetical protein